MKKKWLLSTTKRCLSMEERKPKKKKKKKIKKKKKKKQKKKEKEAKENICLEKVAECFEKKEIKK